MASSPIDSSPSLAPSSKPSPSAATHRAGHAPRWQTQLWQRFVVAAMVGATARVQALSRPAALRFGNGIGQAAYRVAARQRRRALANLHLAYGDDMTAGQRDALTRHVFRHFGRGIVDFLRAPARTPAELSAMTSCDGWEHVEAALQRGKGMVLVTAHLGNWEVLGRWLAAVKNVPLTVVAREADNPALADYVRSMRENAGFTVLSKGESARGLLRALRRGEVILILADQNSGDVFVPFFGIPTGTAAGPATLALHSGAALIPIYCMDTPDGFHITCFPGLDTATQTADDKEANIVRLTAELNRVLESMVRRYPDQWLWLHNRWKSAFERKHRAFWASDDALSAARARWKT